MHFPQLNLVNLPMTSTDALILCDRKGNERQRIKTSLKANSTYVGPRTLSHFRLTHIRSWTFHSTFLVLGHFHRLVRILLASTLPYILLLVLLGGGKRKRDRKV